MYFDNTVYYSYRNQGYDFSTDYVNAEDGSNAQIPSSGIVNLPTSLAVNHPYDAQTSKILVPPEISGIAQFNTTSLPAFPSIVMIQDVQQPIHPRPTTAPHSKRKDKKFACMVQGCNKEFDTQWSLTRYGLVLLK